jgi:hypothetical protein
MNNKIAFIMVFLLFLCSCQVTKTNGHPKFKKPFNKKDYKKACFNKFN